MFKYEKYSLSQCFLIINKKQHLLFHAFACQLLMRRIEKEYIWIKRIYGRFIIYCLMIQEESLTVDKSKIPDPVFYGGIEFNDQGKLISYTDCWEISVLRFLHFVFGQNQKINQERLLKFMDLSSPHCQYLYNYFKENSTYSNREEYYKTGEGLAIRAKWCQFLNNSKVFDLKIEDKYEVKATIPNVLVLFKYFFPKMKANKQQLPAKTWQSLESKQLVKGYEMVLNSIYQDLSFEYKIKVKLEQQLHVWNGEVFYWFNQSIYLNNQHIFNWYINEYYDDKNLLKRTGGHSDYHYAKN